MGAAFFDSSDVIATPYGADPAGVYAHHQWQRPSVQLWVNQKRSRFSGYNSPAPD
jgi:hypothetical protein